MGVSHSWTHWISALARWRYDPGARLSVDVSGDGAEDLVFLHGLGGTHRYWTNGRDPLTFVNCRTVLVDLLGFGDSPRPWCRYSVDRHVRALRLSLPQSGAMTLVAHSMGASPPFFMDSRNSVMCPYPFFIVSRVIHHSPGDLRRSKPDILKSFRVK